MTDHTITITNEINVYGPEPTQKWGSMVWGVNLWGYENIDLYVSVFKPIAETIYCDSDAIKKACKYISNNFSVDADMSSEGLSDQNGWDYLFVDNTTEGENRDFSTYTDVSSNTASYTDLTATSTTWSNV